MAEQKKAARRSFFAGLGLFAAATAVAKLAPPSSSSSDSAATPTEPQGKGYRLSEHIKKYYRTTTV